MQRKKWSLHIILPKDTPPTFIESEGDNFHESQMVTRTRKEEHDLIVENEQAIPTKTMHDLVIPNIGELLNQT